MRDEPWFEDLFAQHATAVHRYLARRAAPSDVADLAADVFVTAWRRRDDVPAEAELPWLYRTAGYVLANHRRKMRPTPVEHLPEEVDDVDPELLVLRDEQVRTALLALGPRDRRVLLLHAWEGLTGEGLAQALGISRGGADAALSRARARLRAVWAEDVDAPEPGRPDRPARARAEAAASGTEPVTQEG